MDGNQEVLSNYYWDEKLLCERGKLLQGPEQCQRVKIFSSLNKGGIILIIEYFLTDSSPSASSGVRYTISILS